MRNPRRFRMARKSFGVTPIVVAALAGAVGVVRLVSPSFAAQDPATAAQALAKAHVVERLAEAIPATHKSVTKGTAPGFVLDPAWPKPLPHHWIIGDVGGIFVDRHDHIWVYHRPRSLGSSDSGIQGV